MLAAERFSTRMFMACSSCSLRRAGSAEFVVTDHGTSMARITPANLCGVLAAAFAARVPVLRVLSS